MKLLLALLVLFPACALTATLSFTAQRTVYLCPPNAPYIMLCKVASQVTSVERFEMPNTDGSYRQATFEEITEAGVNTVVLMSRYDNVHIGPVLAFSMFVGFNPDYHLNTHLFIEMDPLALESLWLRHLP